MAAGVRPSWAWSTRLTIAAMAAVGGLGDQHDHGQVIEELERADHPLARLLAVRAGRLPQGAAQPSPALAASNHQLVRAP